MNVKRGDLKKFQGIVGRVTFADDKTKYVRLERGAWKVQVYNRTELIDPTDAEIDEFNNLPRSLAGIEIPDERPQFEPFVPAKKGDKMRFKGFTQFWMPSLMENAKHLKVGEIYTVDRIAVASSWTAVWLEESSRQFVLSWFEHVPADEVPHELLKGIGGNEGGSFRKASIKEAGEAGAAARWKPRIAVIG